MLLPKRIIIIIPILTVLTLSAFITTPVAKAASSPASSTDWNGPMGSYPFNLDYSSQTQITTSNVGSLQLNCVFPIPAAPSTFKSVLGGLLTPEGDIVTPLIVNGIMYTITNFQLAMALDASNGKIVWTKDLSTLNAPAIGNVTTPGHYHSLYYSGTVRGVPLLWIPCGTDCLIALNALTGDLNLAFDPGFGHPPASDKNFGRNCLASDPASSFAHDWLAIDEASGTLVVGNAASEGINSCRGVFVGFDITKTPPVQLWRSFTIPPQDGSDPNWTINDITAMQNAWVFNPKTNAAVDLKAWATSNPTTFHDFAYSDWGGPTKQYAFNGTHSWAGSATGWGGAWAIDPKTHIAYVATDQPSPDFNATGRTGPDLWSDSIIAVNDLTGAKVWAFQTTSHDMWDWDCSWGVILANATIAGQQKEVVIKGCKNGYLYELDAATGKMYWAFRAQTIKTQYFSDQRIWNDPTNQTSMRIHNWGNYPSVQPFLYNPFGAGAIESNPAFDPTTNKAWVVTYNNPASACATDVLPPQAKYPLNGKCHVTNTLKPPPNATNSTLWGLDAATGQAVCHYNVGDIGYRGGVSVTNGLVVVPRNDGNIDFVSEKDCSLVAQRFIDGALVTQMAIGADKNGKAMLVMPASGAVGSLALGSPFGFLGFPSQPGYIFSLALPSNIPVQTQTTTQVSTSIQTQTQVSTSTVVSTSVTSTTGIDPSTFYAAVGVAVIFVITTGVLAVRRRAPTP